MTLINEDRQLWKRLKSGDRNALDSIYKKHINHLFNYGRKFTSDRELVEDAIHDMFVYLWRKKESLSDTDNIRAYLLYALRNTVVRALKAQKGSALGEHERVLSVEEDNKEAQIIDIERRDEINFLLERSLEILSHREKEAIFLKYYSGMDYDSICNIMEINYQSARNLVSRSIKKMHDYLKLNPPK